MKLMDGGVNYSGMFFGGFGFVSFLPCVVEYDYLLGENVGSQNCWGWKGP